MSNLTVTMTWLGKFGKAEDSVVMKVDCDQGGANMRFDGQAYAEQTIDVGGVCTVTNTNTNSDVETRSVPAYGECSKPFLVTEDTQCDFEAAAYYVGVPMLGPTGVGLMIALFLGVVLVLYRKF